MIHFNANISNPWADDDYWKMLYFKTVRLAKHKFIDFQIDRDCFVFKFSFSYTIRCDHAGFDFMMSLFGYGFDFTFYDNRHWDDDNGTWCNYEEDEDVSNMD